MRLSLALLLFGLTLAVYSPSLFGEFLSWDDQQNFVANPAYRGLDAERLEWMFTTFYKGPYQPLSWVTLGADYLVWGMKPFGYHLTNIVLHAVNAALFFLLASSLFTLAVGREGPERAPVPLMALAAAALFALHPLRVESVAWITERRDVLSGFFYLAAILAYLGYVRAEGGRAVRYVGSLLLFVCALLSKGLTMTLPLSLLVLDAYPLRRFTTEGWGKLVLEKVPFLLASVGAGLLALRGQAETSSLVSTDLGALDRVWITLYGFGFYVSRTLFPVGLSPLYELPVDVSSLYGTFALHGAFAVALVAAALLLVRRVPSLLAATVNYAVVLMPVSGLLLIGKHLVADRYSYLMCMGWALFFGGGLVYVLRKGASRRPSQVAVVALVVVASGVTVRQITYWHDDDALWQRVHALDPDSFYANTELGRLASERRDFGEALGYLERAFETRRDYSSLNSYGLVLVGLGQAAQARDAFEEAIELNGDRPEARMNLARQLTRAGDVAGASREYRAVLDARPGFAPAREALEAIRAERRAETLRGSLDDQLAEAAGDPRMLFRLGRAYAEEGQLENARRFFEELTKVTPDSADAWVNLGNVHVLLEAEDEAVRCYEEALALDPENATAKAVLAQLGRD